MTRSGTIIACRDCDCLQREVEPALHGTAQCVRCGAELFRNKPASLDRTLAFLVAAAILFAAANAFPLLALDTQGVRTTTTLYGASESLWLTGDKTLAALVFTTTIGLPALEMAAMIYLIGMLKLGQRPAAMHQVFRFVEAIKPWGMISVFILGALVSLVKLASIATVIPGLALYCLGALILMLTASEAAFEPRELWERSEALET